MLKKILTGLIIFLAILLMVFLIWFFFFREGVDINQDGNPDGGVNTFFPVNTTFDPDQNTFTIDGEEVDMGDFDIALVPRLRQISTVPTAGYTSFEREVESSDLFVSEGGEESSETFTETVFRYIERATGHMFETTERNLSQERKSNVTIPRIQDAYFGNNGESVVLRYLVQGTKEIETFVSNLETSTTTDEEGRTIEESKLQGFFLADEVDNLDIYNNQITYLTNIGGDGSIVQAGFNNQSNQTEITRSNLSQLIIQKPSTNLLTTTTKADSRVLGYMFFVNQQTGSLSKALGERLGLTTNTNPSGTYVLFSQSVPGSYESYVLNTNTNTISRLPINTFAEKCVWSNNQESVLYCASPERIPRANYPENWYQGLVSFNDVFWEIDLETSSSELILIPEDENKNFDAVDIQISPNDEYLLFINKKDLTLWSYDLVE